ncbi:hypothetical protein, partial [Nonomuraea recticatena]|uniref:hypothetical protein n=1 Tax=Nonomuraea recticatena TaxID=46178 RepID=UPI003D15DE50
VRPADVDAVPPAPVPVPVSVRDDVPDPSGFGFAAPAVPTPARRPAGAVRRPGRAPQGPPRWPHIAMVIAVPTAGTAGFLAALTGPALPIQIVTYTVVGGVVIYKIIGPVRAVAAVITAALNKVGGR